jgi:hypothetical protein
MKRAAIIPLVVALGLLAYNNLPQGADVSADAKRAQQIMAEPLSRTSSQQRKQLAAFYSGVARLLPNLKEAAPDLDNTKFRKVLELAARLYFSKSFPKTAGLADSIHGPNGVIAQLYGLDTGPLDVERMARTLNAIAEACSHPNPAIRMLEDLIP